MKKILAAALTLLFLAPRTVGAAAPGKSGPGAAPPSPYRTETFTGLSLRGIGPAVASGRIGDIAIHPSDHNTWYVVVASGGVWKTVNAGTTFTPIFDSQGSYSIGCVTVDPGNPLVVWVGTGENNSQRSVGYGDGLYKSTDGGQTWENVGLPNSEHIGRILVDPRDSDVVYVAAQGPLWAPGGDRGLYKTVDGGKTWTRCLEISENTGVSDICFDPRDPDVIYASAYQRRRHVWTLIDGGPESAIYKTLDAGATWKKLQNGLPGGDIGRIGLAVSPVDPDVVYAIVEAADKGGFYRSTDRGANWRKMSDYMSTSPQYYNELIPDPKAVDRVYSMDTWMMVTEDGGKTFRGVGEKYKHVDNHALWIEPENTDHLIAGCDGGIYETFDRCATWKFYANLPVKQFYRVAVDNDTPFYNVYGGTQDNNTLGGPSRTNNLHGIRNSDWYITTGGDGFQTQVDPENPDIVYSQSQHGGLVRYDRKSGEQIDIQPQPGRGEPPLRWNWDSPLLLSPFSHTRLYFAANRLFRSDDQGNTWRAVSPDLTRQIDRNRLPVMGRVWSIDAVAKNASTSFYGNCVSLSESPVKEGLIYVGTDDGLIQVTEDGGQTWRRIERFPGVPEMSYVSRLEASRHHEDVVYAAFDNHKMGDFKPYILRSADRGASWTTIAGDLPARGTVYALAEDHLDPNLLFAGTEFGVFFTPDGGGDWIQLKGGMPVIAVRDLAIQRRESDLVVATFGRGFFILDDYSPLRKLSPGVLEKESVLFPVKPAPMYIPAAPLGLREKANQGDAFYTAPNPPFGAVFTYYLKDEIKTLRKQRQDAEKEKIKANQDVFYPSWEDLRKEEREEPPAIILSVTDEAGEVIRRLSAPASAGFHRVAWDLRLPSAEPTTARAPSDDNLWDQASAGPLVVPGNYRVSLARRVGGIVTPLGEPVTFSAVPLGLATLPAADRQALLAFQQQTARLQRAVLGTVEASREAQNRLSHIKRALENTPGSSPDLAARARALETRLKDLNLILMGDPLLDDHNEPAPPSIRSRVQGIVYGHWSSTSEATATFRQAYDIAAAEFGSLLEQMRTLIDVDLRKLEADAEVAGAPWTPGRLPTWKAE